MQVTDEFLQKLLDGDIPNEQEQLLTFAARADGNIALVDDKGIEWVIIYRYANPDLDWRELENLVGTTIPAQQVLDSIEIT